MNFAQAQELVAGLGCFLVDCGHCFQIQDEVNGDVLLATDDHNLDEVLEWVENVECEMDCAWAYEDECDYDDYEDDGQPTMYEEYQDLYGGDDWDHGQYDEY